MSGQTSPCVSNPRTPPTPPPPGRGPPPPPPPCPRGWWGWCPSLGSNCWGLQQIRGWEISGLVGNITFPVSNSFLYCISILFTCRATTGVPWSALPRGGAVPPPLPRGGVVPRKQTSWIGAVSRNQPLWIGAVSLKQPPWIGVVSWKQSSWCRAVF